MTSERTEMELTGLTYKWNMVCRQARPGGLLYQ